MKIKIWCGTAALLILLVGLVVGQLAEAVPRDDFHSRYELKQVVILSRHNIRAPIAGDSSLAKLTAHEWHDFGVDSGELTVHGGQMEEKMGRYARYHLQEEGLLPAGCQPEEEKVNFYANAFQRTIATARHFARGMFPEAEVTVHYKGEVGDADPVFFPGAAGHNSLLDERLKQEMAELGDSEGLTSSVAPGLSLAALVLDNPEVQDTQLKVTVEDGLQLGGSIRPVMKACDALTLQYYELGDSRASFGHSLDLRQWQEIAAVKDLGIHIYRHAPTCARGVARPLLSVFQEEMSLPRRKLTFLCGHDTNIASMLGALEAKETSLPETIEQEAPIGCKLVVEKWQDRAGELFVALKLVYPSTAQLCGWLPLDAAHPPQVLPLHLQETEPNEDGLLTLQAFQQRVAKAIALEEELLQQAD